MRKFLKLLGFVAGIALTTPATQAETLADALASAYKTSNLLDQNQAVLRAADEDAAIAMANLRPVIGYVLNGGWNKTQLGTTVFPSSNSASFELTAQVVLWAGGRGKLAVQAAREQVLAARASLVNVEQQVLLSAVR